VSLALLATIAALGLARSLFVLACALLHRRARQPLAGEPPLVSVIVPAWNEERVLGACLDTIFRSSYANIEVLVVDDGSCDATARVAHACPDDRLRVLVQERNGGKARALGRGLREARGDLVVTVDADTRVSEGAIGALVRALSEPGVGAVSGAVLVGNARGALTRWQAVEYASALHLDRRAQALLGCVTTVPGALGAFRREALLAAGGFSPRTLAEDTDVTLTIARAGFRVRCATDAVAHTEAPVDLHGLLRQRTRWITGNLQCVRAHWPAVLAWLPRRGSGPHTTAPWLAVFGYPGFVWAHLLVWLLLPVGAALAVAEALAGAGPLLGAVGAGVFAVDLLVLQAALAMDTTARHRLRDVVGQRLVFPALLLAAFALVCWRAVRGTACEWGRAPRVGLPADPPGLSRVIIPQRTP
jgi:cellulose synthase/poly-beta-1,6-N-acetylglucosamine synthase-like glycosyltransferase